MNNSYEDNLCNKIPSREQMQIILFALIVISILLGIFSTLGEGDFNIYSLSGNLSTELLGAVITYALLDRIIARHEKVQRDFEQEEELKEKLILQMSSSDNSQALQAVKELKRKGYLYNGSLAGVSLTAANLTNANLEGAELYGCTMFDVAHWKLLDGGAITEVESSNLANCVLDNANLEESTLFGVNLENAKLTNANLLNANLAFANLKNAIVTSDQLSKTLSLWGATMPNGDRYEGQFNLRADLALAHKAFGIDPEDEKAIKEWYFMSKDDWFNAVIFHTIHQLFTNPNLKDLLNTIINRA